jgi:XisI protein
VVVPTDFPREYFDAGIVVLARIADNHIIIDEDTTDRPLVHELVRAGIPRDQIILTYAGEKIPEHMGR